LTSHGLCHQAPSRSPAWPWNAAWRIIEFHDLWHSNQPAGGSSPQCQ
jgi:hypothetical protein